MAGAIKNNIHLIFLVNRAKMLNNISVRTFIVLFLVITAVTLNV
ncbi:chemoreceptor protein, partial [Citrobacter werkmanii]|nr:chemoreceptor protein [Citrobacter werkmanii]